MRVDAVVKRGREVRVGGVPDSNEPVIRSPVAVPVGGECGESAAFLSEGFKPLAVDVRDCERAGKAEPSIFRENMPVFCNQRGSGIDQVLRRFAVTGRAVDVSANGSCRLHRDQAAPVVLFADDLVACREVHREQRSGNAVER